MLLSLAQIWGLYLLAVILINKDVIVKSNVVVGFVEGGGFKLLSF